MNKYHFKMKHISEIMPMALKDLFKDVPKIEHKKEIEITDKTKKQ